MLLTLIIQIILMQNDTNKRKMVTPFMDTDSIYSNSGNPFQYMHKTGGLDGGPRYSNTGSVGSNYLKFETGSLLKCTGNKSLLV